MNGPSTPLTRAATQTDSKRRAIAAMCYTCLGGGPGVAGEIARCTSFGCALWPHRPHQRRAPAGHGAAERAAAVITFHPKSPAAKAAAHPRSLVRAIRAHCASCMGHDQDKAGTGPVVAQSIRDCRSRFPAPKGATGCPLWPHRHKPAQAHLLNPFRTDLGFSIGSPPPSGIPEVPPEPETAPDAAQTPSRDSHRGLRIPLPGGRGQVWSDLYAWGVTPAQNANRGKYHPKLEMLPQLLHDVGQPTPAWVHDLVVAEQRLQARVATFCARQPIPAALTLTLGALSMTPVRYDADKTSLRPGADAPRPKPRMVDAWDCRWAHNQTTVRYLPDEPGVALRYFVTLALRTLPARSPQQLAELVAGIEADLARALDAYTLERRA